MNTLESYIIVSPFGKEEECARIIVNDTSSPFILSGITTVGSEYTFSCWAKSDTSGGITVGDTSVATDPSWNKCRVTFTATSSTFMIIFTSQDTYYIYHPQLELGNVPTDWSPAPEDLAVSDDIENIKESIKTTQTTVSELSLNAQGILASVTSIEKTTSERIDGISTDISSLKQEVEAQITSKDVTLLIKSEMLNGDYNVKTTSGYTFDDVGLTVAKSDSEMKTQITDDGMTVYQNEDPVLKANNAGVDAKNLRATTYLIVGKNSRFEDYGNRTGCFWIGE